MVNHSALAQAAATVNHQRLHEVIHPPRQDIHAGDDKQDDGQAVRDCVDISETEGAYGNAWSYLMAVLQLESTIHLSETVARMHLNRFVNFLPVIHWDPNASPAGFLSEISAKLPLWLVPRDSMTRRL